MKSSFLPWLPSLSVSLGAATLLAACASDPVYVACPDITAPEEGVEAFMQMDDTNEVVNARLNGVTARCEAVEGGIEMAVSIGLKIKRLPAETLPAGVAQINIAGMTVEEDGAVGASETLRYKAGFTDNTQILYPVVDYKVTVKTGQRLVVSLIPGI